MPRKNNPQETIERVINASLKLFKEKGFDKTSMQDIVNASNMSKGAIFYHFKSKEEIFEAAMGREFALAKQRFYTLLNEMKEDTAKEKMKKLIIANFTDEDIHTAIYNTIKAQLSSPHLMIIDMCNNIKEVAPIVSELIKEGIRDGSIVTNFPDELGEVFILLYSHWNHVIPFRCDLPSLHRRLKFLQYMMAELGCDIISDEVIEYNLKVNEKYEIVLREIENE